MNRHWLSLVLALSASACSDIPSNNNTAEQCGCVAEPVRLSPVGQPVETTSTVSPCRTFSLAVAPIGDRPPVSCTMPMTCPALSTGVTGVNVAVAVQDPDVQAALRASPIRYGAVGPVYRVGVGSTDFEVAGPCGDAGECTPVPPGVQQLLDVLIAVNTQEVRRSPCREALNL